MVIITSQEGLLKYTKGHKKDQRRKTKEETGLEKNKTYILNSMKDKRVIQTDTYVRIETQHMT
jgi:hypothetical protein